MSYDVLIKNGTVVDGTGAPRIGRMSQLPRERLLRLAKSLKEQSDVIDASDLIVAPGFVDPHTHYDAQICWDPLFTCSSWHGVTSLVMGNCGVGIAPCNPKRAKLRRGIWSMSKRSLLMCLPKASNGNGRRFQNI